jgi:hypothetical protein
MANTASTQIEDILIDPLERVLSLVGQGVANAQRAMDLNSVATQTLLANDPVLKELGLEATWYHMPTVEIELRLSLSLRREDQIKDNKLVARKFRMYAAPFNASYQNNFGSEVSGTSQIRAKIVSIPPARRAG